MNGLNSATLQTRIGLGKGNSGETNNQLKYNGNSFGYSNPNSKEQTEKALKLATVVIYEQQKEIEELKQQNKDGSTEKSLNLLA